MAKRSQISNRAQPPKIQASQPDPETAQIFQQGLMAHQAGHLSQAKAAYEQVLSRQPAHFDALHLLGVVATQTHDPALAAELIGKAIEINPNSPLAHANHGGALKNLHRLEEALGSYDKAIALKPDFAGAFYNRGNALQELNRLEDALASYNKAIALKPDYAEALNNRGNAMKALKRSDEALESYDKALVLKPDYAEAFNNRGLTLQELKRPDEALAAHDKAISLKPDFAEALNNRGNALQALKQLELALASYDMAIAIKSDYAEAFYNRANALKALNRINEALASYDKAIFLKPEFAEAFYNRGISLQEHNRLEDALASYDKAIRLKPDYSEAFYNRGLLLQELNQLEDALVAYDNAFALKPDYLFLQGIKLHIQMRMCDWRDLKHQLKTLEKNIDDELKVTVPFPILGVMDKPAIQLKASRIYAHEKYPAPVVLEKFKPRFADEKIRIGYYSADFHNHATLFLMAELFEAHDHQKFDLYGFSFGPDQQDEMRSRVSSQFNHFFDVTQKSDHEVAQLSRDLGIDIAVDLKGFTQNSRMGIFAEQCAPLQINYLGYPGTLASPYFDYIVADKILIPQESQQYYTEKIIYLPHSYQVNDSKRKISPKLFTRRELGLPESGFVFCCFNNNYKILPETFDVWMRLLKMVNSSVLWLLQDNPAAVKNLRKEAEIRGVDPARLVFAPRMNLEDHLARLGMADLFIDTLPYNAHTTASDALWAGIPVLTQIGQSFAARVAASLLHAVDLPQLITNTPEEYEARALELANDPLQLSEIKKKVAQSRQTSTLFNGQLFARHIEAAYTEIYRRHLNGLKPDHINVAAFVK